MKKFKGSKSYEDVKKYHYTVGIYLPQIIESEQIMFATAGCQKKREHAVWVSTNEFWEETANKAFMHSDGSISSGDRPSTHFNCGGLARIEVKPKAAPFNWISYVRKSKIPGKLKRGMVAVAKEIDSNPSDWYASYKPIYKDDWLNIELFNWETQSWEPHNGKVENQIENREDELGSCYDNSFDAIFDENINGDSFDELGMDREKVYLCHGTVKAPGGSNPRHGHVWLEFEDQVIDVSNPDKVFKLPKAVYYKLGNVSDVRAFKQKEVYQNTITIGHKGPWI